MATSYASAAGFNLPGIDYTLTKPMNLVGAIETGMNLGNKVLDQPNINRGRKIQGMEQQRVVDGELVTTAAAVGPDGMVSSKMADPIDVELSRSLDRAKEQNLQNTMANRDAATEASVGYKNAQAGTILNPSGAVLDVGGQQVPVLMGTSGPRALPQGSSSTGAVKDGILAGEAVSVVGGRIFNKETGEEVLRLGDQTKLKGVEDLNASTLGKADTALSTIKAAMSAPGRGTGTGLSSRLDPRNYIPGTDAMDFKVINKQMQGQVFLQAFQALKGGGAITEKEGTKATEAMARLDTAQSDEQYLSGLRELEEIVIKGQNWLRQNPAKVPTVSETQQNQSPVSQSPVSQPPVESPPRAASKTTTGTSAQYKAATGKDLAPGSYSDAQGNIFIITP